MRRGVNILNSVLVAIAIAGLILAFTLYGSHLRTAERDKARKQAINSLHYSLEYFYAHNVYYPLKISSESLPTANEGSFIDPNGRKIGDAKGDYRYEPYDCNGDICKGYTLKAFLESEDLYLTHSN